MVTFFKKRFKIIPAYLFWSTLYFLILNKGNLDIIDLIRGIITGTNFGHLYFIVVLIFCYMIFPFINKLVSKIHGLLLFLSITIIGQFFYLSSFTWGYPHIWNWVFYFALGIYISSNPGKFKKIMKSSHKIYTIGLILVLSTSLIYLLVFQRELAYVTTTMRPSVILMSLGILALFLNDFKISNKLLKTFDNNSLNIYFVHPIFIIIGEKIFRLFGITGNNFLLTILMLIFVSFISLLFSTIFNYFKRILFNNL